MKKKTIKIISIILLSPIALIVLFRLFTATMGASLYSATPEITLILRDVATDQPIDKALVKSTWRMEPNDPSIILAFGGLPSIQFHEEFLLTNDQGIATIPAHRKIHWLSAFDVLRMEIFHPLYKYDHTSVPTKHGNKYSQILAEEPHPRKTWSKENTHLRFELIPIVDALNQPNLFNYQEQSSEDKEQTLRFIYMDQRAFAAEYFLTMNYTGLRHSIPDFEKWRAECIATWHRIGETIHWPNGKIGELENHGF